MHNSAYHYTPNRQYVAPGQNVVTPNSYHTGLNPMTINSAYTPVGMCLVNITSATPQPGDRYPFGHMQNTNVQRFPNTGFHPSSRLSSAHISIVIPGNAFAHSSMQNVNPECYSGANTIPVGSVLGLFVCGISFFSGQLFNELFPDCTRSCFSQVVSTTGAVTTSMRGGA